MQKINLEQKLGRFSETWTPKIVAELNGQLAKLAKLEGEFVWHHHDREDELFLVLSGRLEMQFRDGSVTLEPGEMLVVPRGTEHRPVARPRAEVLLIEPASTRNTGNVRDARTVDELDRI